MNFAFIGYLATEEPFATEVADGSFTNVLVLSVIIFAMWIIWCLALIVCCLFNVLRWYWLFALIWGAIGLFFAYMAVASCIQEIVEFS